MNKVLAIVILLVLVASAMKAQEKVVKMQCPECKGSKRITYDGNFREKCKLCRGKGKCTISDIRNNGRFIVYTMINNKRKYDNCMLGHVPSGSGKFYHVLYNESTNTARITDRPEALVHNTEQKRRNSRSRRGSTRKTKGKLKLW